MGPIGSLDTSAPELRGRLAEVVALLARGQTLAAMRTAHEDFERARSAHDGAWGLLALGLGWLAEVRSYNLLPRGCGLNSLDGSNRWNGVDRAKQLMAATAEARAGKMRTKRTRPTDGSSSQRAARLRRLVCAMRVGLRSLPK